jgi:hypothetical protein
LDEIAAFQDRFMREATKAMTTSEADTLFEYIRNSSRITGFKCDMANEALAGYRSAYMKKHFPSQLQRAPLLSSGEGMA